MQIHYECEAGFTVVGRSSVLCQADGTWTRSQLPTCIPVQCPVPHSPAHGKATFTAVAYKVSPPLP